MAATIIERNEALSRRLVAAVEARFPGASLARIECNRLGQTIHVLTHQDATTREAMRAACLEVAEPSGAVLAPAVNGRRPFLVTFKASPRARQVLTWTRYHETLEAAAASALSAVAESYSAGVLLSVAPVVESEVR